MNRANYPRLVEVLEIFCFGVTPDHADFIQITSTLTPLYRQKKTVKKLILTASKLLAVRFAHELDIRFLFPCHRIVDLCGDGLEYLTRRVN
jgi:hypothetical protein